MRDEQTPTRRRTTLEQALAAARSRIGRLEPAEARLAQAQGALLVDTRCADDRRRRGSISGAATFPLSVLPWRLDPDSPYRDPELARLDRLIVLLCADGFSSSLAAAQLVDLGFEDVADVIGGFSAWCAAGLPVEGI